jgi:hypothetical protein
MRNVSNKNCIENQNKHFVFNNPPPPKKIVPFMTDADTYGTSGRDKDGNIKRRMPSECCTTQATDTHTEYVILSFFEGKNGFANAAQCYANT